MMVVARGCDFKDKYLSPCGRGRPEGSGEGAFSVQCSASRFTEKDASLNFLNTEHWILGTDEPLTRPFRATSPIRGELISVNTLFHT